MIVDSSLLLIETNVTSDDETNYDDCTSGSTYNFSREVDIAHDINLNENTESLSPPVSGIILNRNGQKHCSEIFYKESVIFSDSSSTTALDKMVYCSNEVLQSKHKKNFSYDDGDSHKDEQKDCFKAYDPRSLCVYKDKQNDNDTSKFIHSNM